MQRRDHTPGSWLPLKEMGWRFVGSVGARMAALPELRGRVDALPRLKVAFQMVISTMVNAALNDPGPLVLNDVAMTEALAQMLALYAGASGDADGSA